MNRQALIVLVAALALVATTARLGFWQLDRATQKRALQAATDARGALPPLPAEELAREPTQAAAQVHRRTVLQGHWLSRATVFLDNRQMRGQPGFFVVTPLVLADGSAVVVQRGWLPRNLRERSAIAAFDTPAQTVQVSGRIAPAVSRLYDFGTEAAGPIRQNLDLAAYALEVGASLRPLALIQDDDVPPVADGLIRQWHRPSVGVHTNYGYAFQWFALAALTLGLYVWFQLILPRRRR